MQTTVRLLDSLLMTAKPLSQFVLLRVLNQNGKSISTKLLFMSMLLSPLNAQADLPESIQTALSQADLTAANISLLITPVGDKNASRLPPIVQVVDANKDNEDDQRSRTDRSKTERSQSTDSSITIVSSQRIEQKERELKAYTDDPYTHQSLENTPSNLEGNTITNDSSITHGDRADKTSNRRASLPHSTSTATPLLSHQPHVARTPASTMKLIPSFIALDTLGADFVWHTRVYHTGLIIGNRLHGDLIIQGSGDPKMTHERLQNLLYHVQKAGIKHIDGDIIIDSSIFENVSKDPSTFDNAPLRPYNASPDGFLVNFNSISIQSYPALEGNAQLTYSPELANYKLPTSIATRSAHCSQVGSSLAPLWQADRLILNAKLPDRCGEHAFYVAYPDAKDFAARVIEAKWRALGNSIRGKVIAQEAPYDFNKDQPKKQGWSAIALSPLPIVSYPSLALSEQIYDINHFSNNVMTEQVALSLGTYNKNKVQKQSTTPNANLPVSSLYHFGRPKATDYPQALQVINQWWQSTLKSPPPYLTNGSGLCRDCTVTATNLNELLTYAYSHPSFDTYVHSLGIAGVSGTIVSHGERLPQSTAIGRAWIKTGTLNNVTSMAGYVKGLSGQDYVVVGLINSEQALNAYTARPVLDAMLDWTAQH